MGSIWDGKITHFESLEISSSLFSLRLVFEFMFSLLRPAQLGPVVFVFFNFLQFFSSFESFWKFYKVLCPRWHICFLFDFFFFLFLQKQKKKLWREQRILLEITEIRNRTFIKNLIKFILNPMFFHHFLKLSPNIFGMFKNKAGYTATVVACGWAAAVIEVNASFGQEQWGQRPQKNQKK